MSKLIVVSWIDPTGDARDTGKKRFDGANYFPVFEPCDKPSALVYSNCVTPELLQRAQNLADDKKADGYTFARVRVMDDTADVLDIARKSAKEEK
jgi:hypothetical protein